MKWKIFVIFKFILIDFREWEPMSKVDVCFSGQLENGEGGRRKC